MSVIPIEEHKRKRSNITDELEVKISNLEGDLEAKDEQYKEEIKRQNEVIHHIKKNNTNLNCEIDQLKKYNSIIICENFDLKLRVSTLESENKSINVKVDNLEAKLNKSENNREKDKYLNKSAQLISHHFDNIAKKLKKQCPIQGRNALHRQCNHNCEDIYQNCINEVKDLLDDYNDKTIDDTDFKSDGQEIANKYEFKSFIQLEIALSIKRKRNDDIHQEKGLKDYFTINKSLIEEEHKDLINYLILNY